MRRILVGVALAAMLPGSAQAAKKCSDFSTYQEALAYYTRLKEAGEDGWKRLDRDNDGLPCECLPGSEEIEQTACKRRDKKQTARKS